MEVGRITALTTKALDWAYEQEVRMIYDMSVNANQLKTESGRPFVAVPHSVLREVIFGFRTPLNIVQETVDLFQKGKIGSPQLYFSGCHPFQYEVQKHSATPDYLLQYFEHVRPNW
jgi:hypothetical protein